jgi:hypothetical protein
MAVAVMKSGAMTMTKASASVKRGLEQAIRHRNGGSVARLRLQAPPTARRARPEGSLVDFFRKSPLAGAALEVGRRRDKRVK